MRDKPSFFTELKRRNVYKVAVCLHDCRLAGHAGRVDRGSSASSFRYDYERVVLLTLLGFPIALVLAWAFELTPEGLKRTETVDTEQQPTPFFISLG